MNATPTLPGYDPLIGSTLKARYRVLRKIADGGMGSVYEAEHVRLHQQVAIKVLLWQHARETEFLARFRREAEIVARLSHPHIVRIFDVDDTEDGRPFLAMEYLQGETLGKRLKHVKRVSVPEAIRISSQIASALACTHAQQIVHRDLKPENVMLESIAGEPGDFVKLLDFGISKVRGASVSGSNVAIGTPAYMAPEQISASREVDVRADQFSLATLTYEMLTGDRPHNGHDTTALLSDILTRPAPPIREHAPWIPAEVERVIQKALANNPDDRFPSISRFAWALENALAKMSPAPVRSSSRPNWDLPTSGAAAFQHAKSAFESADLDQAVQHAEELFELAVYANDPSAFVLLRTAMPTLEQIFEARVGPPATRLELSTRALDRDKLSLSHNAASLLSFVECATTVGELLDDCGMPRREAVRLLAGLMRRGLVVTLSGRESRANG